jgi:hypothetical protein
MLAVLKLTGVKGRAIGRRPLIIIIQKVATILRELEK